MTRRWWHLSALCIEWAAVMAAMQWGHGAGRWWAFGLAVAATWTVGMCWEGRP